MKRTLMLLAGVISLVVPLAVAAQPVLASTSSGHWTARHLTITPSRLGAVKVGMTAKQASKAAGVRLTSGGDGYYSSSKTPGLALQLGFGASCVLVTAPATAHASSGIRIHSTLAALRRAYKSRLHYHSGQPGYSDPNSYFIRSGRRYLFFHLSHDRKGTVMKMAAGGGLAAANC
jgi:hypothetical protein